MLDKPLDLNAVNCKILYLITVTEPILLLQMRKIRQEMFLTIRRASSISFKTKLKYKRQSDNNEKEKNILF